MRRIAVGPRRGRAACCAFRVFAGASCAVALACSGTAPGGAPSAPEAVPAPEAAARPEQLVLVAIHGLVASDYLASGVAPLAPTLAGLAASGVAVEAMQPVFPPSLHPALATLATGRAPLAHRVFASGAPPGRERGSSGGDGAIAGRALWDAVAEAGGSVAALEWPGVRAERFAGSLPDLEPARRAAGWPEALARSATPEGYELAKRAGAGEPSAWLAGPAHDAVLVRAACDLLAAPTAPKLLLLRLSQTEAALAAAPPGSEPARRAIASADAEVERLLDCLRRAGRLATTALVVAGDHGTLAAHTALRPNAALAGAGLVTVDPMGTVIAWQALARSHGASAFVYARDDDAALLARRALELETRATQAFRLLSADEMLRRGADPEAWFGLEAEPGHVFEDAATGAPMAIAPPSGVGGLVADDPRMAAGLVAWGAGLRSGVRVPVLRQLDVAPTLARLLGVALDGAEGRVIVGALRDVPPAPVASGAAAVP